MQFPRTKTERHRVHIGALSAIPGAIQAGVSLYQAFRGPDPMQRAQMDLGYQNLYDQQRQSLLNSIANLRVMEQSRAAQVDARGNVTEYVPGYGWVTRPSATTQRVMGAEDAEAVRRNVVDAMLGRQQLQRTAGQHINEASAADTILQRYARTPQTTNADVRSGDILSGVAAAQDRTADVRTAALANAVRSGGTGIGSRAALTAANDSSRQGILQTIANAYRDAPAKTNAANASTAATYLDPYNALAGRAQSPLGTQFQASGLGSELSSVMANAARTGVMGSAYANKPGQAPNVSGLTALLGELSKQKNAAWAGAGYGGANLLGGLTGSDWYRDSWLGRNDPFLSSPKQSGGGDDNWAVYRA